MDVLECVITILISLVIGYIGFQLTYHEDSKFIHDYHMANIKKEELTAYTKEIGIACLTIACGIFLIPIFNIVFHNHIGYYIGLVVLILLIVRMCYLTIKYNGSLF